MTSAPTNSALSVILNRKIARPLPNSSQVAILDGTKRDALALDFVLTGRGGVGAGYVRCMGFLFIRIGLTLRQRLASWIVNEYFAYTSESKCPESSIATIFATIPGCSGPGNPAWATPPMAIKRGF